MEVEQIGGHGLSAKSDDEAFLVSVVVNRAAFIASN